MGPLQHTVRGSWAGLFYMRPMGLAGDSQPQTRITLRCTYPFPQSPRLSSFSFLLCPGGHPQPPSLGSHLAKAPVSRSEVQRAFVRGPALLPAGGSVAGMMTMQARSRETWNLVNGHLLFKNVLGPHRALAQLLPLPPSLTGTDLSVTGSSQASLYCP